MFCPNTYNFKRKIRISLSKSTINLDIIREKGEKEAGKFYEAGAAKMDEGGEG